MLLELAVLFWMIGAVPATPAVELQWEAPIGCPDQASIERQVAELRVRHPAPLHRPHVRFRIAQLEDRWHLVGEISGTQSNGRRELDAVTCAELAEAAVLLIAIAIDPGEVGIIPPSSPAATPVISMPPDLPVLAAPVSQGAPSMPARRRPSALLGLSAGLGLGALQVPTGLLRLVLGLRGDTWSVALLQDVWLPGDVRVPQFPEIGGRFWLWSAGLRGCAVRRRRSIEVPLCAAVAAGVMSGRGSGALKVADRQRSPWIAVAAGPGVRVPIGRRVGLSFSAELLVVLAPPRFHITGHGVFCCSERVAGQFLGGLDFRLP